jgi:hypothetical protein
MRLCHGDSGLRPRWRFGSQGDEENQLQRVPLQGRYADARKLFDRLLSRCNDVSLEFDPLTGRMLGNFPQAYSHVGLINCALNLAWQTGRRRSAPSRKGRRSPLRPPQGRMLLRNETATVILEPSAAKTHAKQVFA